MSTKTSIKRIALVAVSALGFGLLSVAPSGAANIGAGLVNSINLTRVTSAPTVGSAVVVNFGAATTATTVTANDTVTFVGALTAFPAGGSVSVTAGNKPVSGSGTKTSITGITKSSTATGPRLVDVGADSTTSVGGNTVTSSATAGIGRFEFTPTRAGVYTLTVWNDAGTANDALDAIEVRQTIDITVAAKAGWSQGGTTVLSTGTSASIPTTTSDAAAKAAARTLGTYVGTILVSVKDTNGDAYTGQVVSAQVSGVGFVGGASATFSSTAATFATNIDTADGSATTTRSASVTDSTGYVAFGVWADGIAGTSTVTISVTDQISGATTVLGTESFTFFGDVAKIEVSTTNFTIGRAGAETGKAVATRTEAGEVTNAGALNASTTTPAFIVKAVDSGDRVANVVLGGGVPTIVSSNPNVITGGTCVGDDGAATYGSGGTGFYNCAFSTSASALSGQSAVLTIRTPNPADTTTFLTATYNVTVGGSAFTHTLSFNKATYTPGEAIVLTRSAVDSAGNPVADGITAPAVSFNKAMGGSAVGASTYVAGRRVSSATAPTIFAPAVTGSFTGSMTGAVAGVSSTITATATVADAASDAKIDAAADAAAEAIDAANAATDAANLAAEAADAATVAAEEARDAADAATAAVEELSTQVATLLAGLRAQITTLANTVAKIAKRVRA